MSIRIDEIPNRNSHPQILLRESWREGHRVRHKTILNLTKLPKPLIDVLKIALKGGIMFESIDKALNIQRALPHGHVAAALGMARVIFHFVLGGAFQIISEAVGQFVSHCAVSILRDELESPVFFPRRDFWAQF